VCGVTAISAIVYLMIHEKVMNRAASQEESSETAPA
jgi:hypothetical protein